VATHDERDEMCPTLTVFRSQILSALGKSARSTTVTQISLLILSWIGPKDLVHLRDVRVVQLAVVVDLAHKGRGKTLRDLFDRDAGGGDTVDVETDLAVRSWG
jgi:hypothetical protein